LIQIDLSGQQWPSLVTLLAAFHESFIASRSSRHLSWPSMTPFATLRHSVHHNAGWPFFW